MDTPSSSSDWVPPTPPPPPPPGAYVGGLGSGPPMPMGAGDATGATATAWAPMQAAPPPPTGSSLLRGFLYALGAASVGGLAFWGISAVANRVFFYLAFAIGLGAAVAAEKGCRQASRSLGLVAATATFLAMAVSLYFIYRTQIVKALPEATIPKWLGLTKAVRLVRLGVQAEPLVGLSALASIVVAGWKGATRH
jgi:hypothetical protein